MKRCEYGPQTSKYYRLLKFCYVPATSAARNSLLFFVAVVYGTNEAKKAGGTHN